MKYNIVMKLNITFDVEASGPAAGIHDMISAGLVVIEPTLNRTFYGETQPIFDKFSIGAYESIGWTREQHEALETTYEDIHRNLMEWTSSLDARLILWSDNPSWDFQWINWICFRYGDRNPFGHSARRVGDYWAGLNNNIADTRGWKKLRKTRHTHNALDDAMGVAEAMLEITKVGQGARLN
jgi:hypothetical protein